MRLQVWGIIDGRVAPVRQKEGYREYIVSPKRRFGAFFKRMFLQNGGLALSSKECFSKTAVWHFLQKNISSKRRFGGFFKRIFLQNDGLVVSSKEYFSKTMVWHFLQKNISSKRRFGDFFKRIFLQNGSLALSSKEYPFKYLFWDLPEHNSLYPSFSGDAAGWRYTVKNGFLSTFLKMNLLMQKTSVLY